MSENSLDTVTEVAQDIAQDQVEQVEQVEQEVTEQVEESHIPQESEVSEPEVSDKPSKEDIKASNMQALRESRNKIQQERDDYARRLKEMEDNLKKKDVDDDDEYEDPTQKELKLIKRHLGEMSSNNSRMKLQSQFPDFGKVVNNDSITVLKHRFPEIASTLDQSTDIYTTGVSAYNIIKKFGLHEFEDNKEQAQRVQNNISKPRPVSSIKSQSALTHASDYSDLNNKEVRDEILRVATERAMNG